MLLNVKNISVNYGPVRALSDISMYINQGEIVAFIGHNGAGKSTLLKIISGMLKPVKGTIEFMGERIDGMAAEKIVKLGISHAPEGRKVFANSTVHLNVEIGAYTRKDKNEIKKDMDKYFKRFPILGKRRNQKAGSLSGGEQQMLAIVRALMSRPKLLLLDEPSLGLGPVIVTEVYKTIKQIRDEGTTILIVEQNAKKALSVADRVYVLANGRIMLSGTAGELAENDDVRKAYLGG